jgi:tRNA modification GTPase
MAAADVLVVCTDAAAASPMPSVSKTARRIDVRTRCDRLPAFGPLPGDVIATSAVDGTGIDRLRRAIADAAAEAAGSPSYATVRLAEGVARARASLGEAAAELARAGESVDEAVVASHVGRAVAAIGEVTGRVIGNDILDRIFSRHCIGK